jgi:hypothetical protein
LEGLKDFSTRSAGLQRAKLVIADGISGARSLLAHPNFSHIDLQPFEWMGRRSLNGFDSAEAGTQRLAETVWLPPIDGSPHPPHCCGGSEVKRHG